MGLLSHAGRLTRNITLYTPRKMRGISPRNYREILIINIKLYVFYRAGSVLSETKSPVKQGLIYQRIGDAPMRRKASLTSFRPKTSSEGGAGWQVVAAVPLSHQIAIYTVQVVDIHPTASLLILIYDRPNRLVNFFLRLFTDSTEFVNNLPLFAVRFFPCICAAVIVFF